jgi:hypothetical protein
MESTLSEILETVFVEAGPSVKSKTISIGTTASSLDLFFDGYLSDLILGAFLDSADEFPPYRISVLMLQDFETFCKYLQVLYPASQLEKPLDFSLTAPFRIFISISQGQVYIFNASSREGYIFLRKSKSLDYRSYVTPFRLMLSWIINELGGELVHASAICRDNEVIVISGGKGSGKSTLALTSGLNGGEVLSDDALVLIESCAYAVYSRAKIEAQNLYTQTLLKYSFDLMNTEHAKKVFPLAILGKKFKLSGNVACIVVPEKSEQIQLIKEQEQSLRVEFINNSLREIFDGDLHNVTRLNQIVDKYNLVLFKASPDMASNFQALASLFNP